MPAVVLLDQRGSRNRGDLVGPFTEELGTARGLRFLLPFERTAGDEMQALLDDPKTLGEVVLTALQSEWWWVGIGLGDVAKPVPTSVREGRGNAFLLARQAIAAAKRARLRVRVLGQHVDASDFEAALHLMGVLFAGRRATAQQAVRLRRQGLTQREISASLGITVQAVSARLRTAHWVEEEAGRRLVQRLAEPLLS